MDRTTTCCFTGHRRLKLPIDGQLYRRLDLEIGWLAEHGISNFIAGGAIGFDTIAAEAVLRARRSIPNIRLHLFLPSPIQTCAWNDKDRERYGIILDAADSVRILGTNNSAACMMQRNRAMVDFSSCVIAFYDHATQTPGVPPHGGTFRTLQYARSQNIPIINLHDSEPGELMIRRDWHLTEN